MGNSSSRSQNVASAPVIEKTLPSSKTMIDVSQLQTMSSGDNCGLARSNSDTQLNTSKQGSQGKSYQRALEWGRDEHFFKLAHTFHTNNY
ncbi:unnamed protein product [Caenorhabditis bovis]|uniref:Uncharacterized protein n=1 Tax=Caenorhabditis bovis TaxID=2654633 RepID=A0A8S1E9F5_9PELO|nr:unnamed protein product [Caenorhabditis bovis]